MSYSKQWIKQHPLMGRYSSSAMKSVLGDFKSNFHENSPLEQKILSIFSPYEKALGWRNLWLALAKAQQKAGLDISDRQLEIQESFLHDIDLDKCAAEEKLTRHDVMAHLHVLKDQMNAVEPNCARHLHLGATSCFVTDNQEILAQHEALTCLATSSKSTELKDDLLQLKASIKARGLKGTTGSQASYYELFNGDFSKVVELEKMVMNQMGFDSAYLITGQTYPRIQDLLLVGQLYNLSLNFEGSTALEVRQKLYNLRKSIGHMAAQQWLERSLDDSAQRRVQISEAFQLFARLIESDEEYCRGINTVKLPETIKNGLDLIIETQAKVLKLMAQIAENYKTVACIGYTHYQVAQPVTYGKRVALWIQHLLPAFELLEKNIQAKELNAREINLALDLWSAASCKIGVDCRLLQHDLELSEPFGKSQIGSSAMAYKKNPMRSERLCSLSRLKLDQLDFSEEPEMSLLCLDSLLQLELSIFSADNEHQVGFAVQELTVSQRLNQVLPFLVSERLLMLAAQKGADRQEMHEIIRLCMLESRKQMQADPNLANPFLELLDASNFPVKQHEVPDLSEPSRYVGFCVQQVEQLTSYLHNLLQKYQYHHHIEEVRV